MSGRFFLGLPSWALIWDRRLLCFYCTRGIRHVYYVFIWNWAFNFLYLSCRPGVYSSREQRRLFGPGVCTVKYGTCLKLQKSKVLLTLTFTFRCVISWKMWKFGAVPNLSPSVLSPPGLIIMSHSNLHVSTVIWNYYFLLFEQVATT